MQPYFYRGKTALVTGASSGIGAAFARRLAAQCERVILVGRNVTRLEQVAGALRELGRAEVHVLPKDLLAPHAAADLRETCDQNRWAVQVVVNNAGFGSFGRFHEMAAADDAEMIRLNATAVCDVAHAFLPDMLQRGDGVLLNTCSSAAFGPTPWFATYGATKAFVLSLSESLWALYRTSGVRVTAVCPGPVDTGFFQKTGDQIDTVRLFQDRLSPETVVTLALRGVDRGQPTVVCDWRTTVQTLGSRLSPRGLVARVAERVMRPPELNPSHERGNP